MKEGGLVGLSQMLDCFLFYNEMGTLRAHHIIDSRVLATLSPSPGNIFCFAVWHLMYLSLKK